ncbi:MAG TPA: protein phosphatase 2C domain-containing protein [Cellulomonas sp.]
MTATVAGVSWGVATDRGSRRQVNEDSFLARLPVFVVADGMGGHESGEVASAYTIEALRGLLDEPTLTPDVVRAHLWRAVARIRSIPTGSGPPPGTTLTGALVVRGPDGPSWLVVNVGDSRTYRLSGGELTQVSTDHSEVAEMVARGLLTVEEAARHPHRHVVTRVLGGGGADEPEPDFFPLPFGAGDRVLVCSDGLTDEVDDARIAEILRTRPDPQDAADHLVAAALVAGGRDNVTVIVVDAPAG